MRDPAFRRSLRSSFADRMLLWLGDWFERFLRLLEGLPSTRSIGLGLVALLVVFVLARFVLAARAQATDVQRLAQRRAGASGDDPWAAAESLVAEGRFEDAAHALYRGVIAALARDERLRLHPSRTSGDYARELRRRSSSSLAPFRAFTRRFDVVVYGNDHADARSLAELAELSAPFRSRARAAA